MFQRFKQEGISLKGLLRNLFSLAIGTLAISAQASPDHPINVEKYNSPDLERFIKGDFPVDPKTGEIQIPDAIRGELIEKGILEQFYSSDRVVCEV